MEKRDKWCKNPTTTYIFFIYYEYRTHGTQSNVRYNKPLEKNNKKVDSAKRDKKAQKAKKKHKKLKKLCITWIPTAYNRHLYYHKRRHH